MTSVAIVSDSTTWTPATSSRIALGRKDRCQRLGVQHPLVEGNTGLLDLLLVFVNHLAVGRHGTGSDGGLGQHGADGLDRLEALVHLLEGFPGSFGVDRARAFSMC